MFEEVRNNSESKRRIIYRLLGLPVVHRLACHKLVSQVCGSQARFVAHRISLIIKDVIALVCLVLFIYFILVFGCAMSATCQWPEVWGLK
jgi:hypothetical protein